MIQLEKPSNDMLGFLCLGPAREWAMRRCDTGNSLCPSSSSSLGDDGLCVGRVKEGAFVAHSITKHLGDRCFLVII